ncbi:MAG: hypothetical protein HFH68_13555 [Lachnospiraceae bacterium]|nr:hypothetical protein [Lachnospiraceae bacterium]
MKIFSKRIYTVVVACLMSCIMFATSALAAGSYSKTTVKLNAYSGGSSTKSTVSSGSVLGDNQSITKVQLRCTVSSGSDPYTLYVKSPDGTTESFTGPIPGDTITTTAFNGENPSGKWTIWIVNDNISSNGNIYPVSTVTVRIQVYYS